MNPGLLVAADRYAQALFEIARLLHRDAEIEAELDAFSAALRSSPDLERSLGNPQLRIEDKRNMLLKIYQERNHEVYEHLLNFLTILFEKNRFHLIHEITSSFKRIADEARGQGVAEIHTAVPLDSRSEGFIVSRLEAMAGYKITVKKEVDPRLVGGVVVKIRNKVIDGSVKHELESMKKELTGTRSI